MARPRKPTAELELNGAFKKDPKRGKARANEPLPNGLLGEPPACLNDNQRDIWREIEALVPVGVLTMADRLVLEVLTRLVAKQRDGDIRASELGILTSCLTRIGLTPADRSRVSVPGAKDEDGADDDFGSFLAREARPSRPN